MCGHRESKENLNCDDVERAWAGISDAVERYRKDLCIRCEMMRNIAALSLRLKRYIESIETSRMEDAGLEARSVPAGAQKLESYLLNGTIYILGSPDLTNYPEFHDCDEMGCSSVSHVIKKVEM